MRSKKFFSQLLARFIGKAKQAETREIDTPAGPVPITTFPVAPVSQQVRSLDAGRLKRMHELDAAAAQFLTVYCYGSSPTLKAYDEAFRRWRKDKSRDFSDEAVIEMLGAHLGNRLASDLDMEWVEVIDEYGTDLGVRSRKYEVIAFPLASVAKRIENYDDNFMEGIYYATMTTIDDGQMKRNTTTETEC
ncbi:DUF3806 domain-containing protein [Massilia sp. Root351]|jgi:hypothetical protein|uniref:DUF3806 domain-containing protein n=1 Tax=Massilia sp. Root351 TaxID=1736522 RepID=UPI000AFE2D9E|nr:DUF3806 domain-containing protein [Massilia sp. Root351]